MTREFLRSLATLGFLMSRVTRAFLGSRIPW